MFEFILVDDSNAERKKKNRSIAHSHVKKRDRRTKRDRQIQRKEPPKKSVVRVAAEGIAEDSVEALWSDHARPLRALPVDSSTSRQSSFSGQDLFPGLDATNGSISTLTSMSPTVDLGVATAFAEAFGTQDPRTRLMLDHGRLLYSARLAQSLFLIRRSSQGPVAGLHARCRRWRLPSTLSGLVSSNVPESGAFPYCGRGWSPALGLSSPIHLLLRFPARPRS